MERQERMLALRTRTTHIFEGCFALHSEEPASLRDAIFFNWAAFTMIALVVRDGIGAATESSDELCVPTDKVNEYWCMLCDERKNVMSVEIENHCRTKKHVSYINWLAEYWGDFPLHELQRYCQHVQKGLWKIPHPVPISWGLEDMFEWNATKSNYHCRLCQKQVDVKHITSWDHQEKLVALGLRTDHSINCINCAEDFTNSSDSVDCSRCRRSMHAHCDKSNSGTFICEECCALQKEYLKRGITARIASIAQPWRHFSDFQSCLHR
jgi:hypothetical protein